MAKPKWDRIWVNARLATMAGSAPYGAIDDGAIAVRGKRIAWVGNANDLPSSPESCARKVVDAAGAWITPGLIDCHTHLVYGGSRADEWERRQKGESYEDIAREGGGILATVRATRAASEGELFDAGARRLGRLIAEGVTTVEVKSGYGLDTASEVKMLRVARKLGEAFDIDVVTSFLGLHSVPPEFAGLADGYVDMVCREMLPAIADEGLADAADAYLEPIAFSAAEVARYFAAAEDLGLPLRLHADQLSDSGGGALAAQFSALSADHLEYVSDVGIAAMAKAGTVAVLLPGAFYFLRESRRPPIEKFRVAGVPMALATDSNPGTSPTQSLLLMLNMACTLFRLTPEEALAGVTCNAAQALGRGDEIGTLERGKRADFVLWDIAHPAELAYGIGANPVRQVVYRGKPRT